MQRIITFLVPHALLSEAGKGLEIWLSYVLLLSCSSLVKQFNLAQSHMQLQ